MGVDIYFYKFDMSSTSMKKNAAVKTFSHLALDELCYLGKSCYPVVSYFCEKFSYDSDRDGYLFVPNGDMKIFLDDVREDRLFPNEIAYNTWFDMYGKPYYDYVTEDGRYMTERYGKEDREVTKSSIRKTFNRELFKELRYVREAVKRGNDFCFYYW